MSDFVNTIDLLGDDVVARQLLDGSITEFKDDVVTSVSTSHFSNCNNLTTIELPNVVGTTNVYDNRHFAKNPKLTTLNLPKLAGFSPYMIEQNDVLEKVVFPSVKNADNGGVMNNKSLRIVDFHIAEKIGNRLLENDTALVCLILRNENICASISTDWLYRTPIASGTGYIYVPRALLSDEDATKDYRRATNWSAYVPNQFRALEDYTVDGTITGEIDESKI